VLFPIDRRDVQGCDLGNAQATPPHQEKQGAIHGVFNRGKELRDVIGAQLLRERSAWLEIMTGLDGIDGERRLVEDEEVKEPFEGMQSPVDGRGGEPLVMLVPNKSTDVAPGDLTQGLSDGREEPAKIQAVALDRMVRIVSHAQVLTEALDFHRRHRSPPKTGLACFNPLHGLIILVSFRRVVEFGVPQRDVNRAVAHQLFQDLE